MLHMQETQLSVMSHQIRLHFLTNGSFKFQLDLTHKTHYHFYNFNPQKHNNPTQEFNLPIAYHIILT